MATSTKKSLQKKYTLLVILLLCMLSFFFFFNFKTSKDEVTTEIPSEKEEISLKVEKICISPLLPSEISEHILEFESEKKHEMLTDYVYDECDLLVERNPSNPADYEKLWTEIYVAITRFDNLVENIPQEEIENAVVAAAYSEKEIVWTKKTQDFLTSKFKMGVGYPTYSEEETHEMLVERQDIIAIVPFEQVKPIHKILSIGERKPTTKDFNANPYPLSDSYYVSISESIVREELIIHLDEKFSDKHYNTENLTNIILTGTSTIGARTHRNLLDQNNDPVFPIRGVADILQKADIAHVSNESPFWPDCTQSEQTIVFCALPESIEMLTYAGINLVGMTGNHIVDYGGDAFRYTLQLYEENDITYFAAGNNEQEAHTPKILEKNNVKFAFLGYNLIPPTIYHAVGNRGGNARISNEILKRDIQNAKENADFVFIDMQWGQEYQHKEVQHQIEYGQAAIEYGADIVTGVHPHWVQGIEYFNDGIIFYGLGNFLFDQLRQNQTREGIMIEHVFYKNRYIGYNVIPTRTADNLQVELAKDKVRESILETVFKYSKINLLKD